MAEIVVIPTAGHGTRMGDICTRINKALLPYRGRPMIGHIIERFDPQSRFIIPVGHLAEQVKWFINECYADRHVEFINVPDHEGPQSGTAITLMQCRHAIDGPFFYVSCDTFWEAVEVLHHDTDQDTCWLGSTSEEDSQRYTMMLAGNNRATRMTYKVRQPPPWMAFTGLMRIADHHGFFQRMASNPSVEFVDSLVMPMNVQDLKSWKDMGTRQSYDHHVKAHDPYDFTKEEEITWITQQRVIKWNLNMSETVKRFARAQAANPSIMPDNLSCGPMLAYDRIDGNTGYHDDNRSGIVDKILPWLSEKVWIKTDVQDIKLASMDFYQAKTRMRIEKFTNKNKKVLKAQSVNGISVSNWQDYLHMVDWHLLINANQAVWIHGDLQPDNVIVSSDGSLRAIDWRSGFGDEPVAGDAHYDLAKLLGGCLIDYSRIKKNQFSAFADEAHNWTVNVPSLEDTTAEARILEFAKRCMLSRQKILSLVPLIFWNMAPLHAEPFDDLLWCMGLLRFKELYGA